MLKINPSSIVIYVASLTLASCVDSNQQDYPSDPSQSNLVSIPQEVIESTNDVTTDQSESPTNEIVGFENQDISPASNISFTQSEVIEFEETTVFTSSEDEAVSDSTTSNDLESDNIVEFENQDISPASNISSRQSENTEFEETTVITSSEDEAVTDSTTSDDLETDNAVQSSASFAEPPSVSAINTISTDQRASAFPSSATPFENLYFPLDVDSEYTELSYVDDYNDLVITQPSFRNSSGQFSILAIPINRGYQDKFKVYNEEVFLGEINISQNSMIAQNSTPGQYSITVLNSHIDGLSQEVSVYTESSLISSPDGFLNNLSAAQVALSRLQEITDNIESLILNSNGLADEPEGRFIFNPANLETLDGLFHHLISRYSSDSDFLAHAFATLRSRLLTNGPNINMIFAATKYQLNNWDANAALASLDIYSKNTSEKTHISSLNEQLDIVKIALFPALVANELENLRLKTGRTSITEAIRLLRKSETESPIQPNALFLDALETLEQFESRLEL